MPREGHGSRNLEPTTGLFGKISVMPREGHGSRNTIDDILATDWTVMPREGHGSRNLSDWLCTSQNGISHAPRGAWE